MQRPIAVSPFKCRIWNLHDRLEGEITEESCKAEIASFLAHGQLIPVLGRRLRGDPDYEIELIYGARRLFVARHLNKELKVDLRDMSDREAIIAMDMENRLRKDLSPYERGLSYIQWLRSGQFNSQDEIARALGVSTAQVSRLLRMSRLPAVIVNAFRSPTDICENWGLELMDALEDTNRRDATILAARALGRNSPRLPGRDVFRQMCAYPGVGKSRPKAGAHDKVIMGEDGSPLFRIKYQNYAIALVMPIERVSREAMKQIETSLVSILQAEPLKPAILAADLRLVIPTVATELSRKDAMDDRPHWNAIDNHILDAVSSDR